MSARFLMDTNVLAYRYDPSDRVRGMRASAVCRVLARDRSGAITTQVVGELYAVLTRKMADRLARADAIEAVSLEYDSWPVLPVDSSIVAHAVELAAGTGISIWDAQIVASAEAYGIDTVLSEDLSAGAAYGSVVVLNPFAPGFDAESLG